MTNAIPITTLFLDIDGVLLTDGRDHHAHQRAAAHFTLEWAEMEVRHQLTFGTCAKLSALGLPLHRS